MPKRCPLRADEVNCSCDIQRLNRYLSRAHGNKLEYRVEPNLLGGGGGGKSRRWFGWHPLSYTTVFIHEPYNISICPLKAGKKKRLLHATTFTVPSAHKAAQAGRQADWRRDEEQALFYLAGIFARLRAIASSTAFSCFNNSSRRDRVLLGLPEPVLVAKAEPGTVGLPSSAAGPFPDDLGGGDRGRFLRNRKIWSGLHFYSCHYKHRDNKNKCCYYQL